MRAPAGLKTMRRLGCAAAVCMLLAAELRPQGAPAVDPQQIRTQIKHLGQWYSEEFQKEASLFLTRSGKGSVPYLMEALNDDDLSRQARVVEILGNLRDANARLPLILLYQREKSVLIRCKVLEALGKSRDEAVFDFVAARVKDANLRIRAFAVWAMGELRTPKAVPLLMEVIKSDAGPPVIAAIDALGKCGGARQVPLLMEYLRHWDVQTRYVAALSLGELANRATVPALFEALEWETHIDVQEALAKSLGKIGGKEAISRFLEILKKGPYPFDQRVAAVGLRAAGTQAVFPLLELLERGSVEDKLQAAKILVSLKSAGAVPYFLKMLDSENTTERLMAVVSLGDLGDAAIDKRLEPLSASGELIIRQAAWEARRKIHAQDLRRDSE
ncbi:MAG: hypothetical protein A3G41_02355 [Elusimicrobia bacterium RIFCSPLOWO2_12_FULL_59_9]|nr:MAG: hypothetical protein A3G41_02355 [Elusimicrobia bacterium RIFCSPLOWO2_12_FULL_59_9]